MVAMPQMRIAAALPEGVDSFIAEGITRAPQKGHADAVC